MVERAAEGLAHVGQLIGLQLVEHGVADHDAGVVGRADALELAGGGEAVAGQRQGAADEVAQLQQVVPQETAGAVGQLAVGVRVLQHVLEQGGGGHHLADDVQRGLDVAEGHRQLALGLVHEVLHVGHLVLADLGGVDRHRVAGQRAFHVLEHVGHCGGLAVQPDVVRAEGRSAHADAVPGLEVVGHVSGVLHALLERAQLEPQGQLAVPALPAVDLRHAEAPVHQHSGIRFHEFADLRILFGGVFGVAVQIEGFRRDAGHRGALGIPKGSIKHFSFTSCIFGSA